MAEVKLTPKAAKELARHAAPMAVPYERSEWRRPISARVASLLADHGFLERVEQSEQIGRERRRYFNLYRISPAGLSLLQSMKGE